MMQPDSELHTDEPDLKLIDCLARGMSQEKAAEECGLHRNTVYRRMKDAEFKLKVSDTRRAILEEATSTLTGAMGQAVDTLRTLMGSDSERTRLDSAKALIQLLVPLRESLDTIERFERLEAAIKSRATL